MAVDEKKKAPEAAAEAAVPFFKRKVVIIIAAVLLLALVGGGAALLLGGKSKAKDKDPAAAAESGAVPEGGVPVAIKKPIVALEPFVVNLADDGEARYARFKVEIEVKSEAAKKELEDNLPFVRDAALALLSAKKTADVQSVEGKAQMKAEVLTAVNAVLPSKSAVKVLFTDLVVQ